MLFVDNNCLVPLEYVLNSWGKNKRVIEVDDNDGYVIDICNLLGLEQPCPATCKAILEHLETPVVALQKVIASNAYHSYIYARHILHGRFELGEPAIATSAEYSYWYAKNVIKGRFELGEPTIATSTCHSYKYARDVIGGRFILGEDAISTDSEYDYIYKRDIYSRIA